MDFYYRCLALTKDETAAQKGHWDSLCQVDFARLDNRTGTRNT